VKIAFSSNTLSFVLIAILGISCTLPMAGCGGSGGPAAVTDDADAQAIADYERMVQEDEAQADADEGE
jgi:hypothetical protein